MSKRLKTAIALVVLICLSFGFVPEPFVSTVSRNLLALAEDIQAAMDAQTVTDTLETNGWYYRLCADGDAVLLGHVNPGITAVSVPAQLNGAWVTRIGSKAFADNAALTEIRIPAQIADIAGDAFPNAGNLTVASYGGTAAFRFAKARGMRFDSLSRFDFFDDIVDLSEMKSSQWQFGGGMLTLSAPYARHLTIGARLFLPGRGEYPEGVPVQVLSVNGKTAAATVLGFAETVESYHVDNASLTPDYDNIQILAPGVTLNRPRAAQRGGSTGQATGTGTLPLEFDVELKLPHKWKIEGSVSYKPSVSVSADYHQSGLEMLEFNLKADQETSVTVSKEGKKEFDEGSALNFNTLRDVESSEYPIASIPLTGGTLIHVNLEVSLEFTITGSVTVKSSCSTTNTLSYNYGVLRQTKSKVDKGTSMSAAVEFEAEFKVALALVVGFDAAKTVIKIAELALCLTLDAQATYSTLSPVCLDVEVSLTLSLVGSVGILKVMVLGRDYTPGGGSAEDNAINGSFTLGGEVLRLDYEIFKYQKHFEIPERKWVDKCTHTDGEFALVTLYTTFSDTSVVSVRRGECFDDTNRPLSPTRDGYSFAGWYSSDGFEEETYWNFWQDTVEEDMTLYAKWIDKTTGEVLRPDEVDIGDTGADILKYEIRQDDAGNDYIAVTGLKDAPTTLLIPGRIDGIPVKQIDKTAFMGTVRVYHSSDPDDWETKFVCEDLVYLYIADGVENIGVGALSTNGSLIPKLRSVRLPATLKTAPSLFGSYNEAPLTLREIIFPKGMERVPDALLMHMNRGQVKHIALPDSVISIGESAFSNSTIESIDLPDGLQEIGDEAFYMSRLESIDLPESLTYLGTHSLATNTLKHVTYPKHLDQVHVSEYGIYGNYGASPFDSTCTGFTGTTIPEGVTGIPDCFFSQATSLKEISLPDTLETIGVGAFSSTAIETIEIPDGLTQLEGFDNCLALQSIRVPASVTSIGDFHGCDNLKEVVLEEGLTTLPRQAFRSVSSLETLILPGTLKYIEAGAFQNAPLASVVFPEGLQYIRSEGSSNTQTFARTKEAVFLGRNTWINSSSVLSGVERVYCYEGSEPDDHFSDLKENGYVPNLQIIHIPEDHFGVTWNCPDISMTIPVTFARRGDLLTAPLVPPQVCFDPLVWYKDPEFTQPWNFANDTMPAHAFTLYARREGGGSGLSFDVTNGTAVVTGYSGAASLLSIPDTLGGVPVTGLADGAIPGCVERLSLPASLSDVENGAFRYASRLKVIEMASGQGNRAMDDDLYRTEDGVLFKGDVLVCYPRGRADARYTVPVGVTTIGPGAIADNTRLVGLELPAGIALEERAITRCASLIEARFAADAASVGSGCFTGCSGDLNLVCAAEAPVLSAFAEANSLNFNLFELGYMVDGAWLTALRVPAGEPLPEIVPASGGERCFTGWSDEAADGPLYAAATMPYDNLTLYAVFAEAFTSEPDGDGVRLTRYNGIDTAVLVPDAIGNAAVNAIDDDCFVGTPMTSLRGNRGSVAEAFAAAHDLPFEALTYTLAFETNGGTQFDSRTLCATDPVTLPDTVRYSFELLGWYVDPDMTIPWTGAVMPPHDLTLYAAWKRVDDMHYAPYSFVTEADGLVITGYTGYNRTAVVPDEINGVPVKAIGAFAFAGNEGLISVTVGAGIQEIRNCAFSGSGICRVELLGATRIGDCAFSGCENLSEVVLPETLRTIDSYAFEGCGNLLRLTLPNGVESLGEGVFEGCAWLSTLVLPEALDEIPAAAFSGCARLRALHIPAGVCEIAPDAFDGCKALASFTAADENSYYRAVDGILFSKDGAQLIRYPAGRQNAEYTVSDGVTAIAEAAMANCRLQTLTLNSELVVIGAQALRGAEQLTDIVFAENGQLAAIEAQAFSGCINLRAVTLPDSLTSIGAEAFRPSGLTEISIPAGATVGKDALPEGVGVTVYGRTGSDAERYAQAHGNRFVDLDQGDVPVAGIALNADTLAMTVGETAALSAILTPDDTTETSVTWESSDTAVATVSGNGVVTARNTGEAVVVAYSAGGDYALCTVTVAGASVPAESIRLSHTSIIVQTDSFQAIGATLLPANTTETVTWTSNDDAIAVWDNGFVMGRREGVTTLTATTESGLSATCTVTVQTEPAPVITIPTVVLRFPSELEEIEAEAFRGLPVTRILLPYGLKTVGERAFADCRNLSVVFIPPTVETIAPDAFGEDVSGLTIYYSGYDNAATEFIEAHDLDSYYCYFFPGYEEYHMDDDD